MDIRSNTSPSRGGGDGVGAVGEAWARWPRLGIVGPSSRVVEEISHGADASVASELAYGRLGRAAIDAAAHFLKDDPEGLRQLMDAVAVDLLRRHRCRSGQDSEGVWGATESGDDLARLGPSAQALGAAVRPPAVCPPCGSPRRLRPDCGAAHTSGREGTRDGVDGPRRALAVL